MRSPHSTRTRTFQMFCKRARACVKQPDSYKYQDITLKQSIVCDCAHTRHVQRDICIQCAKFNKKRVCVYGCVFDSLDCREVKKGRGGRGEQ